MEEAAVSYASSSSLEILDHEDIEEELRDALREKDASPLFCRDISQETLTTSQYSQVVFTDVLDVYAASSDIKISFENQGGDVSSKDKVGIFRTPFLEPSDFLTFAWVKKIEGYYGSGEVVFAKEYLPKELDFYQFQYIKEDGNVAGASIPWQLMPVSSKSPQSADQAEPAAAQPSDDHKSDDSALHKSADSLLHKSADYALHKPADLSLEETADPCSSAGNGSLATQNEATTVFMERLQKIGNQINGDVSKLSTLAIAEQIKALQLGSHDVTEQLATMLEHKATTSDQLLKQVVMIVRVLASMEVTEGQPFKQFLIKNLAQGSRLTSHLQETAEEASAHKEARTSETTENSLQTTGVTSQTTENTSQTTEVTSQTTDNKTQTTEVTSQTTENMSKTTKNTSQTTDVNSANDYHKVERIDTMLTQDESLVHVFSSLGSRLELTEKQLTDVNKQLTDAKKQLTDARNQLTEKAFQVDALTASLSDLQEREKSLLDELASKESSIVALQGDYSSTLELVEKMKIEEEEMQQHQSDDTELLSQNEQLQNEKRKVMEEWKESLDQVKALKEEQLATQLLTLRLEGETVQLKQRLEVAVQEKAEMVQKLLSEVEKRTTMMDNFDVLHADLQALKASKEALETELKETNIMLEETQHSKDAAAKAIVELERKIRELTLQIQNGGPGVVVENKNGANHEDSTNQLNVTCDTVRNVRGNDFVERDDIRNVRMCDQTTTVISAAETARHADSDVVRVLTQIGSQLEAAKARIKELETELSKVKGNEMETIQILEAALKDADTSVARLSRNNQDLQEKVDKYKVQTEFAERLVEKSRQLELETQAVVEKEKGALLAKIKELEARLQNGAMEYRKLAVSKRKQEEEINGLRDQIVSLQQQAMTAGDDMSTISSSSQDLTTTRRMTEPDEAEYEDEASSSLSTSCSENSNNLMNSLRIETELQEANNQAAEAHDAATPPPAAAAAGQPNSSVDPFNELLDVVRRKDYPALLGLLQSKSAGLQGVLEENLKKYRLVLASEARESTCLPFTRGTVQTYITRTNVLIALESVREWAKKGDVTGFGRALRRAELGLGEYIEESNLPAYLATIQESIKDLSSSDILRKAVIRETLDRVNQQNELPAPLKPEVVEPPGIPEMRPKSPARYRLCNDGRVEKLGDLDGDVKAELATQQEEEMATLLVCPMCQLGFQKEEQSKFENHVQGHFIHEEQGRWDLGID